MSVDERIKTVELFNTREEAYDCAAWFGMFDLMQSVGSLERQKLDAITDIGIYVVKTCICIAEYPSNLMTNLNTWKSKSVKKNVLQKVGMYDDDDRVNATLESALAVRLDEEWRSELIKESTYGDLLQIAQDLAGQYTPRAISAIERGNGFNQVFSDVYRDINFYVGLYDPDR